MITKNVTYDISKMYRVNTIKKYIQTSVTFININVYIIIYKEK